MNKKSLMNSSTYKSLALEINFVLEMTTTPSSLRLADSAVTDISPTG